MTDHANHLRRADWTVAPTEHRTAVRLVETWHYSKSAPNTSVARHGLYRRSDAALTGDPYGVAMWMPPTRAAGESIAGEHWRNVLNLSRLAVAPDLPTNAASYHRRHPPAWPSQSSSPPSRASDAPTPGPYTAPDSEHPT